MAVDVRTGGIRGADLRVAACEVWFRRLIGLPVSEATTKYFAKPNPLVMKGLHIS